MGEKQEEKKGFKVVDKRFFAQEKENEESERAKEKATREEAIPNITFSSFIYSLSSTCLIHLGEIPEPVSGTYKKSLALAKQTIDLLEILSEKTKGNLTPEEEGLLKTSLMELRIRYIKALSSQT
jgi:hypothetical protein